MSFETNVAESLSSASSKDVEDSKYSESSLETVESNTESLDASISVKENEISHNLADFRAATYGPIWDANSLFIPDELCQQPYEKIKELHPKIHLYILYLIYCKKVLQTRKLDHCDRVELWTKFKNDHELINSVAESLSSASSEDVEDSKSRGVSPPSMK